MVSKSLAAGADLERALFKAVEARFLVCHRCITTSILLSCLMSWGPTGGPVDGVLFMQIY